MEFVHQGYEEGSTIAAVATPPGEGGVAVIRVSGKSSLAIVAEVFSGPVREYVSHTAHLGKVRNRLGEIVDEVLCLVMLSPKSYTGEDTVELYCHGGELITRKVLEVILQAGARTAEPGEFTLRAFLNGKMGLAQAEAVQELIAAKNEWALSQARQQLQGSLSSQITHFQKELTEIAAILEAWVDFPEEGLEFASFEEILSALRRVRSAMWKLKESFHNGRMLSSGISLCLLGPPNVGKSSLMNALLGKERAIVTAKAGTTRDVLEEPLSIGNLHFRLMDTAGIRDAEEEVEREGIRRSLLAREDADLLLIVLDASAPLCKEGEALLAQAPVHKTIVVRNKMDLCSGEALCLAHPHTVLLSAKLREGLDGLYEMIQQVILQGNAMAKEEVVLTKQRHHQALSHAIESLDALLVGLETGMSAEFVAADMRSTLRSLGAIIGTNITEDILSAIFSKFCVGK